MFERRKMKTLFKKTGFTLIELMIFIAVLAIIIVIGTGTHRYYQWLTKENNYSNAVRQMKLQKKILSSLPFDSLPPEIIPVETDGRVKLSNMDIVPGSVALFTQKDGEGPYNIALDNKSFNVDEKNGIVTIRDTCYKGKKVFVKYSFLLPDRGEAATVPLKEPYKIRLLNNPVNVITKMELLEGNNFTLISSKFYRIKEGAKEVIIDKKYAGKVVRVTYTGSMVRNICTGEFLYDDLTPANEPARFKMVKILEDYRSLKNIETALLVVKR